MCTHGKSTRMQSSISSGLVCFEGDMVDSGAADVFMYGIPSSFPEGHSTFGHEKNIDLHVKLWGPYGEEDLLVFKHPDWKEQDCDSL